MPPVEKKRSSKRFAEWEERPVKEFDPENEAPDEDEESGSDESGDDLAGTEHYVSVGKSKLRQKDEIALGPEYRGARISRAVLEESDEDEDEEDEDEEGSDLDGESGEEEFDDPETADLEADFVDDDAEIDSDNAFGDSDDEVQKRFKFSEGAKTKTKEPKETGGRIKKRPTAADFLSDGDEEEEDEEDGEGLSDDGDETDDSEDDFDSEVYRNGASLFDVEAEESEDDEGDDDEEEDSFINDEEEDEEDGSGEDEDMEEDEDEEEEAEQKADDEDGDDEYVELKRIMGEGQKSIVDTMSQKAKEDAAKGSAIRVQRRAFDSILNLRIRLQKALVATNTFSTVEDSQESETEPYQAAEEAAVKLWNTIDSVRHSLLPDGKAKAGMKRKRDIESETSSQEIWESMEVIEKVAMAHRRKVLDKWSNRVRSATAAVSTRRLVDNANQTLLSVLDDQMLSTDRLVKKARTPRSCAPAQAAKKLEDKDIYDDADFYQLLLKELVDQRSLDTGAPGESVPTVRWAALKEAKTRKQVDRKASKGRKLRFTVHEKLQNFMAPEDRRKWEEHAIDRFFGTLFGQKMELKEDDASDEEMGGVNIEEQGLRLFQG
ncbi:apoptosis-antagonizing transcription factor [Cercophora newfieldiana]|uniref:Protein BFR2 n=1 Tax=Cercophora newfieldiana TaxID=92897 RepID=A0AA40CJY8_9PEZI|nr:apoptosis-antagonizing transcription factor [Cercophora newfieldiana]